MIDGEWVNTYTGVETTALEIEGTCL